MKSYVQRLDTITKTYAHDPEVAHSSADAILLEALESAGLDDVVRAYGRVEAACKWWAAS